MAIDRIVLVTKRTRLVQLVEQHLTEGAAEFVLNSHGQSIEEYRAEDSAYREALSMLHKAIPSDVSSTAIERDDLPHFLFRDKDLIIVCGPDGLFVNLAKFVQNQPVITVNPDRSRVTGNVMLTAPSQVRELIEQIRAGKHVVDQLPFLKADIDGKHVVWAINDVFIGRKDQVSARYKLAYDGAEEHHSSSGIIVSTGAGATAWISSIVNMLQGLVRRSVPHRLLDMPGITSEELVFVVREPYRSPQTQANIVSGRIHPGTAFAAYSEMASGGCVFSDGMADEAIAWNAGSIVTISIGDRFINRVLPDQ